MTNRLAEAKSLYLRKHAENPINWWPWCDEALATAKAQNKPIFLSIGYSSCHWCTVMEGEAFSHGAIAEYMNANFLPIKVDREERPDLDSIYMQALQMMSGQGGWPLNIFLSPDDLVPFYAGTYFPIDPRYGRPGFLQVLQALRRYYDVEKEDLHQRKAVIMESLLASVDLSDHSDQEVADNELLRRGLEASIRIITPNSQGNSFPMIPYRELALRSDRFNLNSQSRERGLDLALGGIYDHIGGGFHRYTVDPTWTVPHFEKMLYDNGQILEYLANLWSAGFTEPAFAQAVTGTVQWLRREMTAPEGYFYAAQDADSFTHPAAFEPEEGAFYVWSYEQLKQLLTPEELTELQQEFTVTPNGNFEGRNVLQRLHSGALSSTLEVVQRELFSSRYGASYESLATFPPARNNHEAKQFNWPGRIPPVTDTKMIVAWNSLMISGLARAAGVFQVPLYLELGAGAANFILEHQFVDGRFHRLNYGGEPTVLAQSEDYAFFIKALLDLHQASLLGTEYSFWLEKAIALQDEFEKFLWSRDNGGFFNTSSDASQDLIVRERSYVDNATPSANGVAMVNLVRLALLTENLHYLDLAEQGLKGFRNVMQNSPQSCPSLFTAFDWYQHSTLIQTTTEQIHSLGSQYLPTAVFTVGRNLPEGSLGLVCRGLKCLAPATTTEQLWQQIQHSQGNLVNPKS
jgi:uncharacterized protein YyaL (SSP411 family)